LRAILDERSRRSVPERVVETRFLRLVKEAGLPLPTPQLKVFDGGRFLARVDFAYPEAKVAIEVDGYRYHSGYAAWNHDRQRRNGLIAAG
jgi:hypothetical protein